MQGLAKAGNVAKAFADLLPELSNVDKLVFKDWGLLELSRLIEEVNSEKLVAK